MRWSPVLIVVACGALACDSTEPAPASVYIFFTGGNAQTDTVGQDLPIPYSVLVRDGDAVPIPGVAVTWSVLTGSGGVSANVTVTDANGVARVTHRLGLATGFHRVRATVPGARDTLVFQAIAVAGPPAQSAKVAGDLQSGDAGAALAAYYVRVTDAYGNPRTNVAVQFTALGGSVLPTSTATNTLGNAIATHTLGTAYGHDTVLAIIPLLNDTLTFVSRTIGVIPVLVSTPVPASYGLHDTFVRDGIAFACVWNSGVIIYDVGDGRAGGTPAAPVAIDVVLTNDGGVPGGRQVHNAWWFHNPVLDEKRYLFVGQEGPGSVGSSSSGDIHVIDVSDLSNAVEVASYRMAGAGVHNFWMDEQAQVLYAAYYNGGVVALDVSGTLTGNLASREIARIQPGGPGNTFTWGVQLHTNGSLYAVDMLSGVWQLRHTGNTLAAVGGGNNVPERFGSDLWVHGSYLYSGTWGARAGNQGNMVKIWQLGGDGAPSLVNSFTIPNVGTVSDVQVSVDGRVLVLSTEGGAGNGLYVYGLDDPRNPLLLARARNLSLHTATVADIAGRRYVFAAKNPGSPAMAVFDITDFVQ